MSLQSSFAAIKSAYTAEMKRQSGLTGVSLAVAVRDMMSIVDSEINSSGLTHRAKTALTGQIALGILNEAAGLATLSINVHRDSIKPALYNGVNIAAVHNYGATVKNWPPQFSHVGVHYMEKAVEKFNAKYAGTFTAKLF